MYVRKKNILYKQLQCFVEKFTSHDVFQNVSASLILFLSVSGRITRISYIIIGIFLRNLGRKISIVKSLRPFYSFRFQDIVC